jgi:hypothetical protein
LAVYGLVVCLRFAVLSPSKGKKGVVNQTPPLTEARRPDTS